MNKSDVIAFFDSQAGNWDAEMIKCQEKIDTILDAAEVTEGKTVLDVACGTGVLFPDYIKRNVRKCVGIDISPVMIETAKSKFGGIKNIELVCADAENLVFAREFDCVVVYNAFPHFVDREQLFESLAGCLKNCGRLTVAHGMGREELTRLHSERAESVSAILPDTDEMAKLMSKYFSVDVTVSTAGIYIVSGKVKSPFD